MSKRSLTASLQGQKLLRKALERKNLTQMALVNERGIASWSTINRFFNGRPVERELFINICDELDLTWQDIVAYPELEIPELAPLDQLWQQIISLGSPTEKMGMILATEKTLGWSKKIAGRYEKTVRLGSRVQFEVDLETTGYLLLIQKDTLGQLYCFCPSCFAPQTRLETGKTSLPQESSAATSLAIEGTPGKEQILAVITQNTPNFEWLPQENDQPLELKENFLAQLLDYINQSQDNQIFYTEYQIIN